MGKRMYDWMAIQAFHDAGHGFKACCKQFGVTHYSWMKAVDHGDLRLRPEARRMGSWADGRRIYDWSAVQAYYDEGHTFREAQRQFGFRTGAWHDAKLRGELRPRPSKIPLDELLLRGGSRHNVKIRLMRAGIMRNECSKCGLTEWLGESINMHIDHINGVRNDHRLENLRMLCPNCHSQTPTYGGKNMRRRRRLQDGSPFV